MPDDLGQGKVAQLGVPLLVQQHVAGLDVAVHHLHVEALVQVGQAGEGEEQHSRRGNGAEGGGAQDEMNVHRAMRVRQGASGRKVESGTMCRGTMQCLQAGC